MTTQPTAFYASIANLKLLSARFDLGNGLELRDRYSCIFAAPMLAFSRPVHQGQPTPGPWVPAQIGYHHEADVELVIPAHYRHPKLSHEEIARVLVVMLRLQLNPEILMLVSSTASLDELALSSGVTPFAKEVRHRYFRLSLVSPPNVQQALPWVKQYWPVAADLFANNAAFRLAMEAFETGQFVESSALALVSIWGALEGIFVGEKNELSFRLSMYAATYLKPPGQARLDLQKRIAKLYTKRSAAAHGAPSHQSEDVTESFVLLRDAIVAMIHAGKVPTRADLNDLLLGGSKEAA